MVSRYTPQTFSVAPHARPMSHLLVSLYTKATMFATHVKAKPYNRNQEGGSAPDICGCRIALCHCVAVAYRVVLMSAYIFNIQTQMISCDADSTLKC